jgi:hypothetical protein
MVTFTAEIERFGEKGEKTGWYYIAVPKDLANRMKANCRKSFRVKGSLDHLEITSLALTPIGEGDFILALKKEIRQIIKKEVGAVLQVKLQEDLDFKIGIPDDLKLCLKDEAILMERFTALPGSHQNWYINWLNAAKTEPTRTKRLVKIVSAMDRDLSFPEMMKAGKEKKTKLSLVISEPTADLHLDDTEKGFPKYSGAHF